MRMHCDIGLLMLQDATDLSQLARFWLRKLELHGKLQEKLPRVT